jgi:hypothetical protein
VKSPILERIDAEIADGRPWRAKEILRGRLAGVWPGPVVSERYGQLLASMGDHLEAGKFLFLSGVREPQYEGHIALFLRRYTRSGPDNLVAQFPKSFRRERFITLPPQLQNDLKALGVREDAFGERVQVSHPSSRWGNFVATAGGLLILVFLIVGIGVGFRQVVLWISALWR